MHPYYDSEQKKINNRTSYIVLFISFISIACIIFIVALSDKLCDDEYVDYKVVILNDNDVILYNINDMTDTICLRLENAYCLADEWMIQVQH